jgi:cytoskeletal protein RodZ
MKKNNDQLDQLFERFSDQWDIHEPDENHYDRFLEKQSRRKSKRQYWIPLSIAATILLIVGFFTFFNENANAKEQVFASKETRETDSIFTCMIKMELEKVNEKKSPLNEKIIADALVQMKILDADYEKIKQELVKNGESKQIIHAMIRNLQTRISFLEDVLDHLEKNDEFKNDTDEKTI